MSLESATWISELDVNNPAATDIRAQGDDQIRLVKSVVKASFPSASKAFYNPSSAAKNANYSVVAADMNKVFVLTTSGGAITMTLPVLAVGDAGWECSFLKVGTDANAYFIAPPSGTIQSGEVAGLVKTRRCIPGHRTKVVWTGTAWIAERVPRVPVGTVLENQLAAVPVGYEAAQGATLASASTNYPDYNAVVGSGVLPDHGGRVAAGLEAAATRLTAAGSGIDGATVGAAGGAETVTLAQANLPNVTLGSGTIAVTQGSHAHDIKYTSAQSQAGAGQFNVASITTVGSSTTTGGAITASAGALTVSGATDSINGGVTQTVVNKTQPTIVVRKIVVVE